LTKHAAVPHGQQAIDASVLRGSGPPMSRRLAPLALAVCAAGCSADAPAEPGDGGGGAGGSPERSHVLTGASGGGPPTYDCDVLGLPGHCAPVERCVARPEHQPTAGLCTGDADIQCCTPFGETFCDPDVIASPNAGRTEEAPGSGGCPPGMLAIPGAAKVGFCVDRFEASLVTLAGDSWSPFVHPDGTPLRAVSVEGAVPQAYVDAVSAADACAHAGKRLCTDAEWLRACRGPSGAFYPYGDALEVGVCNDHRDLHPAVQYFGTSDAWIWSALGNACIDQLPGTVAPAGSFDGCVTSEGAFDMMGNLHEWTADPAGTFRGGFYVDTALNGPGCLYATTAHDVSHWDYSTGFRCCADA
jgi:formylglycine-generating enzyme